MTKYCRSCGRRLEDEDRFCVVCGTPTSGPPTPKRKYVSFGLLVIAIIVVASISILQETGLAPTQPVGLTPQTQIQQSSQAGTRTAATTQSEVHSQSQTSSATMSPQQTYTSRETQISYAKSDQYFDIYFTSCQLSADQKHLRIRGSITYKGPVGVKMVSLSLTISTVDWTTIGQGTGENLPLDMSPGQTLAIIVVMQLQYTPAELKTMNIQTVKLKASAHYCVAAFVGCRIGGDYTYTDTIQIQEILKV